MAKINTVFSLTDNVTNPLKRINSQLQSVGSSFSNVGMKIIGVNQALELFRKGVSMIKGVGGIFADFVSEAGNAQSIIARLTVALGDANLAVDKFKEIQKFAAVTPFDVQGTAQAYVMLKNAGMEIEELLPTIRMIGDLAQGNNQAFNNMALNMMQIKANGKATAMDLRQFSTFGVNISEALKQIGREGDNSFEAVFQAMKHLTSEGGTFYNSMNMGAQTLQGRMANLQDSIQQLKTSIGNTMLPVVQRWQSAFAEFFSNLKNWFEDVKKYPDRIKEYFNSLYYKLDSLVAMIIHLGTITTVVATAMATAWVVAHWPLALITTLVITLTRVMFDLIDGVNQSSLAMSGFANQCERAGNIFGKVAGYIVGTITGLLNVVYNVIAVVYNMIQYGVDMIVGLFTHPFKTIARGFIDLANSVIQVLSTISGAIDLVFGGQLNRRLNEMSSRLEAFKSKHLGGVFETQKLELKDVYGAGSFAQSTSGILSDIGNIFDKSFGSLFDKSMIQDAIKGSFDFGGSGALTVSDKNLVDIAKDWQELLNKQAVQRFNLKYSQVTPSVNIENVEVHKDADADTFLDKITSTIMEIYNSSLRRF